MRPVTCSGLRGLRGWGRLGVLPFVVSGGSGCPAACGAGGWGVRGPGCGWGRGGFLGFGGVWLGVDQACVVVVFAAPGRM